MGSLFYGWNFAWYSNYFKYYNSFFVSFVSRLSRGGIKEKTMKVKLIKFPKKPIPSAKKIATRGLYEIISPKSKKRDYGKKIKKGKY